MVNNQKQELLTSIHYSIDKRANINKYSLYSLEMPFPHHYYQQNFKVKI